MTSVVPPEGLPPPERSGEEIREAAEEILRRPEFRNEPSLYDRVIGWLGERLNDVLSVLTGGGRGAVIAWLFLLGAAAAVGYLVVRIVRDGPVGPARRRPGPTVSVKEGRRAASDWRAEADAHAAAGRWRDAIRCRWRAAVAALVERGRLADTPGLTAGDYRLMVGQALPGAADRFDAATDIFEAAWYGGAEVDATDHDLVVAAVTSVERAAQPPEEPGTAAQVVAGRAGPS